MGADFKIVLKSYFYGYKLVQALISQGYASHIHGDFV